jgi:hypothetical protein
MAVVKTSEVDQNMYQSTWDNDISYADRYLEDEQILTWPLLRKKKEHGGRMKVKMRIFFSETAHELLHLDKRSVVQWKIMTYLEVMSNFLWKSSLIWDVQTSEVVAKFEPVNVGPLYFVCW